MKLHFAPSLLLAIVLFFTSTVSVEASPQQQDMEDAIIQALNATSQELGLGISATKDFDIGGYPFWDIHTTGTHIGIKDCGSENGAKEAFAEFNGVFTRIDFHGYASYQTTMAYMVRINRYMYIAWYVGNTSPAEAVRITEVFYRHAVASGFMVDDGSLNVTPTATETAPPTITETPQPGAPITLRAFAENYAQVTDTIDNSANFSSVDISGRVTDLNTGVGIGGATIEITSGASSGSTLSATDGSYSLTAIVPNGQDSGSISGFDFALPVNVDLTIEVIPAQSELLADGASASGVSVQVRDSQGNPLKDRAFTLEVSADAGPGVISSSQATTDENGMIQATYTAFKPDPGSSVGSPRHEVTISARDNATGIVGSNSIFVNQYQLTVLSGEYIPACTQCVFPAEFTILVTDYWNNPIPNAPLTLRIESGSSSGTLVLDPNSTVNQQEITLTADGNGRATAYYKWQGSVDVSEIVEHVVILEETTNAQETKDVNVHGIDIGVYRIEEAGFTGVTGQQAFLKIYFKEYAHPDLPLDRFNADSPNKLSLRVTISQYHSDGVNTSLAFESAGGWEQDERGFFVKMYATPHMPYIIPVNDGNSWYEVRVDPVIDQDVFLPDLFRPNNDNIFVLTTGSPGGWLHIWLQDGVLTPHSWTGVVFKCVGRFLPFVGDAITVIDTLNQTYNKDLLGLGQSTAQVLTDALDKKSAITSPKLLTKLDMNKGTALNNVVSCLQDAYSVYKEKNKQSAFSSGGVCAALVSPLVSINESDAEMIATYQDRFVQGMMLDSPEERAVVVFGLEADNVVLRDSAGNVFNDLDRMSAEGNVAAFILPAGDQFQLEMASDHAFGVGVYEASSDVSSRKTFRHEVQTDTDLTASMAIGGASDYALKLDYDKDGVFDETLNTQAITLDVVKPQITGLLPEQGAAVPANDASILASYTDNPGGVGIDLQEVKIFVDGVDRTSQANVQPEFLSLALSDIGVGDHAARLVVSDLDGNANVTEWTFTVQSGSSFQLNNTTLLFVVGGGVLLLLLLGGIMLIWFMWRKRRQTAPGVVQGGRVKQSGTVQDEQGQWWYQDPQSGDWLLWDGNAWQPAARRPMLSLTPPRPPRRKTSGSCIFTLIAAFILAVLILGGISLMAFKFFPQYQIQTGKGDLTQILKMGGGGLLVSVLGLILLNGGFKSIITRRAVVEDEWGRRREKRGCLAVIDGLGRVLFGVLLLSGGLGMMGLVIYQEVLPWLGI